MSLLHEYQSEQQQAAKLKAVQQQVRDGKLLPVIDRVLPLTDSNFKEGLQALIDRKVFGKVVFVP